MISPCSKYCSCLSLNHIVCTYEMPTQCLIRLGLILKYCYVNLQGFLNFLNIQTFCGKNNKSTRIWASQNYIRHLRWNFPLEKTWQMSIFKRTHCQFLWISVRFFKIKLDQNYQKLALWRRENTHEKRAQKQKESTNFSKNETYVNCKGHKISEAD